jgi:PPM family protein phosphatase
VKPTQGTATVASVKKALDLPAVEYAERSDPGRDPEKQVNEDACGHRQTRFGHLCVVCDGMGGHAAGREAAELALATIFEAFDHAIEPAEPSAVLRTALEQASQRVYGMRTSEIALGRPGSTVVAVLLNAQGTDVAHVGDSRAYLVHEGQIRRLTKDHSIVQELVDRGLLTPQQAVHHPEANRITRALGMAADVEVEISSHGVRQVAGDAFVLCSDGLCDLVEDQEILGVVAAEPPAQAVGKLVDLANARGGHDNVTVIVLRARETAVGPAVSVAPTVAQTTTTEALPAAAPNATLPEEAARSVGPTSVLAAGRQGRPALIAALALAAVAAVLLGGVLWSHFEERRGKRNARTAGPSLLDLPSASAIGDASLAPLTPESIVNPSTSIPAEPIAPLESASAPAPKKRSR